MRRREPLLLIALVAALALAGCAEKPAASASAATTPPASRPAPAPESPYFETSGPLVVENQVDVLAQRDGVVARIVADVGAPVQKGQLLAQFDDRQLRADVESYQAKVRSMELNQKNFEAETRVVESDLQRSEQMWAAQLITQQQLEHDRYKLEAQKFQAQREAEIIRENRATLRSLELELEKTRVLAPFSGIVARRYVRAGQRVAANDRLFWVTATGPLKVQFTLPESFAGRLRRGQEVTVLAPSAPAEEHRARVTSVSPVVDPASGTIEVRAEIVGAASALRPGMTATVRVSKAR